MSKRIFIAIPFLLFIVSVALRVGAVLHNTPFWVDEFSTGTTATQIVEKGLSVFIDPPIGFETNNSIAYLLTAISFRLFGVSEISARLFPFIFGSLIASMVYLLGSTINRKWGGLFGALLVATSYFQIVWSIQARGYALLQFEILSAVILYALLLNSTKRKRKLFFLYALLLTGIIGVLTHYLFMILILVLLLHWIAICRAEFIEFIKTRTGSLLTISSIVLSLVFFFKSGFLSTFISYLYSSFFQANNLRYYHSFLWREYGLITFLAILGCISTFKKHFQMCSLLVFYVFLHMIFVTFFFGHHMTKYLLPIFPILLFYVGLFIEDLSEMFKIEYVNVVTTYSKSLKRVFAPVIGLLMIIFIISNSNKFTLIPKTYYSINHDFREIANIDYHVIYAPILNKVQSSGDQNVAVIETWPGRARWYLGIDFKNVYLLRWENEPGLANGHSRQTPYTQHSDGTKITPSGERLISTVDDLKKVMESHQSGYIFIDDSTMPQDIIQFADKSLNKEVYVDKYYLEDNPFSIWPATLYGW